MIRVASSPGGPGWSGPTRATERQVPVLCDGSAGTEPKAGNSLPKGDPVPRKTAVNSETLLGRKTRVLRVDDVDEKQPKQKTRPKRGRPVEIPVPKREDVLRDLAKVARPRKPP